MGAIVASNNAKDFGRVNGLQVENWAKQKAVAATKRGSVGVHVKNRKNSPGARFAFGT